MQAADRVTFGRAMVAVVLSLGIAAVACSSDEALRPADEGPGTGSGGGGGSSADDAGGAGEDDDATPAPCSDLENDGALVDGVAQAGDPPIGTGGTVIDGRYGLTDYQVYVGTGVPGLTGKVYRSVISIADGVLQQVVEEQRSSASLDAGTNEVRSTSSFVTSDTDFIVVPICPASAAGGTFSYTATDSRLVWSNLTTGEVWTFDLRP